jgi:hypothetical protein
MITQSAEKHSTLINIQAAEVNILVDFASPHVAVSARVTVERRSSIHARYGVLFVLGATLLKMN